MVILDCADTVIESQAMKRRALLQTIPGVAALPAAVRASLLERTKLSSLGAERTPAKETGGKEAERGQASTAVYELRVYHVYEGKLDDILRRFREHTMKLFEKHGMKNVAYWVPLDDPLKGKTLIYILEHPSREAATANWQAFRDDPEWQSVRDKSEANGKLVEKIDSTYMALTDFSPRVE